MDGRRNDQTCPSGRCREGANLLGVVGSDGRVGFVTPTIPVTVLFAERAESVGRTGSRFRFAEPCAERACQHWGDDRCQLIDRFVSNESSDEMTMPETRLPVCGIRASCRWYDQHGSHACSVCPLILREPSATNATT